MNGRKGFMCCVGLVACVMMQTAGADEPASRIIDLTHSYDADTVFWPTADGFSLHSDFKGTTEGGWYYEANTFCTAEHGGTHLDAPIHFAAGRHHTDEIPLERLIGPAVVIDVSRQAAADRDYQVSIADFENWEARHGRLPDNIIILLRTGFAARWPDRAAYMGTDERGPDAVAKLHFPGLHPDAARWLVTHRSVHSIGLDTPSIDYGQTGNFETHQVLFEANIPAFENVAAMDELPAKGFEVMALPMKIGGGSGGPLRIVARVP
ncbi:cyclase family protein [Elongatibacter sediminis]|uniref:Cyclase family protein n=1 Tax=Elongatibacter sediminis TaxID=3119006 RepID=A0AAW9RBR3_9GAMM